VIELVVDFSTTTVLLDDVGTHEEEEEEEDCFGITCFTTPARSGVESGVSVRLLDDGLVLEALLNKLGVLGFFM
tara:strand:+ start:1388 stop:1609 length:222 start_codon:yes stop_codon:yes gene_type:complete